MSKMLVYSGLKGKLSREIIIIMDVKNYNDVSSDDKSNKAKQNFGQFS